MVELRGILVVLEGVNGAGKTSLLKIITDYYDDIQVPYSIYKFPDRNGKNGKKIDQYLKEKLSITSMYDILDMFAQNRKQVCRRIENDIANGKIVLCDRYVFSSIAYQIPPCVTCSNKIAKYCAVIGHFDKDMPMPDITFLIKGNFLCDRGIVTKEIFHYVDSKQREILNILGVVVSQYATKKVEVQNRRGKKCMTAIDMIREIDNYLM